MLQFRLPLVTNQRWTICPEEELQPRLSPADCLGVILGMVLVKFGQLREGEHATGLGSSFPERNGRGVVALSFVDKRQARSGIKK